MTINKSLLVWSAADLATTPGAAGTTFSVQPNASPDLMSFTDGSASIDEIPSDFNPQDTDQILTGILEGTAINTTAEFESASLVTDGTDTFWVYYIHDGAGNSGYVAEQPLVAGQTYTVVSTDPSVNFDNGALANADEATPLYADFADGVVEGTGGDDVITAGSGYADLDGERVDGSDGQGPAGQVDTIVGGVGNDTIDAGAGDDLVYGDHAPGTGLSAGQNDFVVDGYFKGENLHLTNDHFNSDGATQFMVDTAPTKIRFVDSDNDLDTDAPNEAINPGESGTVEIDGELYRYAADFQQTFTGSDGNSYEFIVVDVDLNNDGSTGFGVGGFATHNDRAVEDGQILLPVGTPPPAGVTLTSQGTGTVTLIPPGGVDYSTLSGYDASGQGYDDSIAGGAGNDTLVGGLGDDSVSGGTGEDLIAGDDNSAFHADNPDALIWTPPGTVTFSYATGTNLGNGVSGGQNHRANVAHTEVSDLQVFLPDGDLDITTGESIGFSFVDENGQTVIVQDATVQQTAFSTGADDTGVVTAQGVDQYGNQVAVLIKLTDNGGTSASPINAGNAFYDNDVDPGNGTDVTLSPGQTTSALSGDGNDTLRGDGGSDTLLGGDGDDSLEGGDGGDQISGGAGTDWASYESSDAAVSVSLSADQPVNQTGGVEAAGGHAEGDTLSGIENLRGSDHDDLLEGDGGVNVIAGGAGNDQLYGAGGDDTVMGEAGDDIVQGGAGNDELSGGTGNDSLNGGTGADLISGGVGDDKFFLHPGGTGQDTISDFNAGNTGALDDDNQDNNDFVNLAGHYNQVNYDAAVAAGAIDPTVIRNPLQWMRADQADDGILNDTLAGWSATDSLTLQNGGAPVSEADLTYDNTNVICFVAGTLITTPKGRVPIEQLAPGDMVLTRDSGLRAVRWIGSTKRRACGNVAPIRIAEGVLGNTRDLLVSPNHRMLVVSPEAELILGNHEVLIAAKHLVDGKNIHPVTGGFVEYLHVLFDEHEVILAEDCWSESFHPGRVGMDTLCEDSRAELLKFFPELADVSTTVEKPTARMTLKQHEAALVLPSVPLFRNATKGAA